MCTPTDLALFLFNAFQFFCRAEKTIVATETRIDEREGRPTSCFVKELVGRVEYIRGPRLSSYGRWQTLQAGIHAESIMRTNRSWSIIFLMPLKKLTWFLSACAERRDWRNSTSA